MYESAHCVLEALPVTLFAALNVTQGSVSGLGFIVVVSSAAMTLRYFWRHAFNTRGLRDTHKILQLESGEIFASWSPLSQ